MFQENDPLAKEEEIPIEAFEDAPFIITEYTPGSDVHRILKKHKIHPDIRYVTRNEFSSLSMVEHELGYSILPGLLLRGQQGKFVKRPLKPTITRQLGLAYSSLKNLSPASKTFLEYAKDFLLDELSQYSCRVNDILSHLFIKLHETPPALSRFSCCKCQFFPSLLTSSN